MKCSFTAAICPPYPSSHSFPFLMRGKASAAAKISLWTDCSGVFQSFAARTQGDSQGQGDRSALSNAVCIGTINAHKKKNCCFFLKREAEQRTQIGMELPHPPKKKKRLAFFFLPHFIFLSVNIVTPLSQNPKRQSILSRISGDTSALVKNLLSTSSYENVSYIDPFVAPHFNLLLNQYCLV